MTVHTLPPHLAARSGNDICRGEGAVFCRMPLAGDIGIACGEVVVTDTRGAIGTDRTTSAEGAGFDLGAPHMSMVALPPWTCVVAGKQPIRCKITIFGGVPLAHQIGIEGGKIVFTGYRFASCTVGAAGAAV